MAGRENAESVLTALNDLASRGGLEPVNRLLADLNYAVSTQPLSIRDWGKAASEAVADPPVMLAEHDGFQVIYAPLRTDGRLRLGDERAVVVRLLRDHPYSLFAFSDSSRRHWHFLNVKYSDRPDRRRLYRRISVGPYERLRTAAEQIAMWMLDSDYDGRSLFPCQVSFPIADDKSGWAPLARNLRAEIDESLKVIGLG